MKSSTSESLSGEAVRFPTSLGRREALGDRGASSTSLSAMGSTTECEGGRGCRGVSVTSVLTGDETQRLAGRLRFEVRAGGGGGGCIICD